MVEHICGVCGSTDHIKPATNNCPNCGTELVDTEECRGDCDRVLWYNAQTLSNAVIGDAAKEREEAKSRGEYNPDARDNLCSKTCRKNVRGY